MRARDASLLLDIPYRSQLDGTPWQRANCGPATLAMILEAYGIRATASDLRNVVNVLQGSWGYDDGTGWEALRMITGGYGLEVLGLTSRDGYYRQWTLAEVREHVLKGHPVMLLANYPYLPGNGGSSYREDHYIVVTGLAGDRFVYHDSAYYGEDGSSLVMEPEILRRAWANSILPLTAMAVAGGSDRPRLAALVGKGSEMAQFSGRGWSDSGGGGHAPVPDQQPQATKVVASAGARSEDAGIVSAFPGIPRDGGSLDKDSHLLDGDWWLADEQVKQAIMISQIEMLGAEETVPWPYGELPAVFGLLVLASHALPGRFWRYM
ncbi:MAG: C39 family peptidase [Chloroflexi bacterium]|nr:C39 family peptidase [Chloroflexota bacterium]